MARFAAQFTERLKTRVPTLRHFIDRARQDARNPAYDLLPLLNLDQRDAFTRTLAAFSPKTTDLVLSPAARDLVAQLRTDGVTAYQPRLAAPVLDGLVDYFKATPCHDPWRGHLGAFAWDQPASEETNIGYYHWEEVLCAPGLVELMNAPDILAVAEAYLGCKPTIDNIGCAWSYPGRNTAKGVQRFHRDFDCARSFKAFYYLSDIDLESGPHVYVRGSHRDRRLESGKAQTDAAIAETFGEADILTLAAPAGTWFLEDVYGFHKGMLPVTRPRLLLSVEYNLYPSPLSPKTPLLPREPRFDPYINRLFLK